MNAELYEYQDRMTKETNRALIMCKNKVHDQIKADLDKILKRIISRQIDAMITRLANDYLNKMKKSGQLKNLLEKQVELKVKNLVNKKLTIETN
jgi:hypothetical protein